ncbi:MAG: ATP-binding cassette domain-containing protein, partial [Myxococcales bacterium]|nr:ATP-binding cassette domain-containing protein [Myxococcales bacterium]
IGLIPCDEGEVVFDGQPLTAQNTLENRLRMGYVIQSGGLFPHLTARQNAVLMARQSGWSQDRITARVKELAELARFREDLLDRFPAQLSGGQRQRVSLMRALMLDPKMIFLDEPLGALDPLVRARLQEDLVGVFRSLKKTVVMVTHDMGEAWFFGHSVVLMRKGSILQMGTVEDLVQRPVDRFVTKFIRAQRSPLADLEAAS